MSMYSLIIWYIQLVCALKHFSDLDLTPFELNQLVDHGLHVETLLASQPQQNGRLTLTHLAHVEIN